MTKLSELTGYWKNRSFSKHALARALFGMERVFDDDEEEKNAESAFAAFSIRIVPIKMAQISKSFDYTNTHTRVE